MKKRNKNIVFLFLAVVFFQFLASCGETPIPRPYGYFRVELPENHYELYTNSSLPYSFEKSAYSTIMVHTKPGEKYWIDITYPKLNAFLYGSYMPVNGNLFNLTEESRKIVYRHTVKADAIGERTYENPSAKVFGIYYEIEGNAASPAQFILTDSVRHFFRAALYFDNVPNKDSIAPMSDFIKRDIIRMMETFRWKKPN